MKRTKTFLAMIAMAIIATEAAIVLLVIHSTGNDLVALSIFLLEVMGVCLLLSIGYWSLDYVENAMVFMNEARDEPVARVCNEPLRKLADVIDLELYKRRKVQ